MENASKALIMAGAILIAMLVISLGIMIFNNLSNSVKTDSSLQQQDISSFNSKLTPYLGNNVSGSQVKALIQLVRSINQNSITTDDNERRVTVTFGGATLVGLRANETEVTYNRDNINENIRTNVYYKVESSFNNLGLIDVINVTYVSGNLSGAGENPVGNGPVHETQPVQVVE